MKNSANAKCICNFCICGRHRCPQDRGTIGKEPYTYEPTHTEYETAYDKCHPYQARRPSFRPKQQDHSPKTPMDIQSTYCDAFLKHNSASPRKPFRPRYAPLSSDPMDIVTIYTQDYNLKNGKRSDSYKPESNYARSNAKVDQETMYSVTFKEHGKDDWAWCRATPIKHKECIENFGSGATRTESTSVMKNDFRQHEKPERATLHRPQPETQIEAGAFETDTSYKKDYSKKQIKPVHAIRPQEYQAPTARFEGSSTVKSDYTPHPGHRREPPFRPPINQQPEKTQFASSTTTGEAYCEWPARRMDKPAWAKQKAYEPTPNENVYSSSYQSDFVRPAGYQRAHLVKPVPQDKDLLHGPRNSGVPKVTHYREQFVPFSGKAPAKSFKQNQVYEPPTEKFQAESVYQSNYTGDRVPPATLCPQQRRNSDEAPHSIDFHTTYKDTFKADRPASCPAKELLTASDEFGHIGFRNGHQYYVQKSPRRCKTPKDLDPLFPATPESQKTDRERSSSRPPSAGKTPRSPSKADRPASSRTSRPTTPRASSRPSSGHKDTKTPAQTSPRKATLSNRNNSNSNAAHKTSAPKSSSPRKTDTKAANKNSSKTTPKTSPRPASAGADKKAAPKADKGGAKAGSTVPPPIRRPPRKDTEAPEEVPTKPVTVASAIKPATGATVPSTANKSPPVAPLTVTTTPAASSVKPAAATTPAASSAKPAATSPAASNAKPAATPPTASSAMSAATTPAASSAKPAVTTAPAVSNVMPPGPTTSVAKPASTKVATPPVQPLATEVAASKPVEKPAMPNMVSTSPMSTTAPPAPVTNSVPIKSELATTASLVEPMPIKPITAATAAAAPTSAPLPPPTLVAAPPAPVMPPVPPQQQQPVVPPMDLSMFDSNSSPVSQPLREPNDLSPKMPVIAPPPAPAQPVVRMGNGPREANLLD